MVAGGFAVTEAGQVYYMQRQYDSGDIPLYHIHCLYPLSVLFDDECIYMALGKPVFTKFYAGKNKLVVRWKNTGAKKYIVCYRVKGTSKWQKKTVTARGVVLRNLKSGKYYQVKIIAKNGSQKTVSNVKTSAKIK